MALPSMEECNFYNAQENIYYCFPVCQYHRDHEFHQVQNKTMESIAKCLNKRSLLKEMSKPTEITSSIQDIAVSNPTSIIISDPPNPCVNSITTITTSSNKRKKSTYIELYESAELEYSKLKMSSGSRRSHVLKICVCSVCYENENLTEYDEDQMSSCKVKSYKHRSRLCWLVSHEYMLCGLSG